MGGLSQTFELAYGGERTLPIPFGASAGKDEIDGFVNFSPKTTGVVVVEESSSKILTLPDSFRWCAISIDCEVLPVSPMRCVIPGVLCKIEACISLRYQRHP